MNWLESLISDLKTGDLATEDRHVNSFRFIWFHNFTALEGKQKHMEHQSCLQPVTVSITTFHTTNIGFNMNPSTIHHTWLCLKIG